MFTRLLVISVFGFMTCAVFASDVVDDGATAFDNMDLIVADNRRKDRRDGRQDNRDEKQDCRHEEGRVGHDKRECKHEDGNDGDDAEAEGDQGDKDDEENA